MTADHELLQRYHRNREEPAFGELVRRHGGTVFAAALRQTGQREAAEEVTQAVFALLARKAGLLAPETPMAAWLHKVVRHEALHYIRGEARRRNREQLAAAAAMNESHDEEPQWQALSPVIDDALAHLPESDREALLLRFFHGLSLRDVGAAIQSSEEAAKKRVSRALEKLRGVLTRRGVAASAAGLVAALTTHAPAAPLSAATAATVTTQALASAASAGSAGMFTTLFAAMSAAKLTTAAAVLAFATPIALQVRENARASAPDAAVVADSNSKAAAPPPAAAVPLALPGNAKEPIDPRLAQIAAELPSLQGSDASPERLLAILPLIFDLPADQLPKALELLAGSNVRPLQQALFARWAQIDPQAAADQAEAVEPSLRGTAWSGLLSIWVRRDASAALARIEKLPEGLMREVITCSAFRRLVPANPTEAIAQAATLKDKKLSDYGRKMALENWAEKDPDAALAWIRDHEAVEKQPGAEKVVLDSLGIERPQDAFRVAMQNENFHQKEETVRFALQQMAVTHPMETAQRLLELPPELQTENLAMNVTLGMVETDPAAIGMLIEKLPSSEFRDGILMNRYNRGSPLDPATAVTDAMAYHNESRRNQLIKIQFPAWLKSDAAAARNWLQSQAMLPDAFKQQLLNR